MDWILTHLHETIAALVTVVIFLSIFRLHRDPNNDFNVLDTVMENGRVSRIAFVFMGSWMALTFVFIGQHLQGKMTDAFYMAYGTVCFAPIIAKMFAGPAPPATPKE
jgi:predicted membrane protein